MIVSESAVVGKALQVSPAQQLWPLSGSGVWIANIAVAFAYAGAASVCLMLAIPPGYASAVWAPAGIGLAAWLAFGGAVWPGIWLGAAAANLGIVGTPVLTALAVGAGNAAEAALAGVLIARFVNLRHRFEHPATVWRFAAIAFGAALIAATNGVAVLALTGQLPWNEFGTHWLTWWLGDATGIIIVAPLLLCWSEPGNGRTAGEKRVEAQLFAALFALCAMLVGAGSFAKESVQTLAYLMIPLVVWAAARLDQRAVTAASFAISAVAVLDMLDGAAQMFSPMSLNESLLLLQLFVSAVALAGLTLSALAGEVVRANARLEAAQSELERRVAERTVELERALAWQALLARRMVKIRDEERARLAADLHDGVAQDVSSVGISLDLMRVGKATKDARWLDERILEGLAIVKRAGKSLREVIGGLRLPGLEGQTLGSALRRHAAEFEKRTGILVTVAVPQGRDSLPLKVKDALLRIGMEALANVAKHADAKTVRLSLETGAHSARLLVEDDGRGFSPSAEPQAAPSGSGILIMQERAMALQGWLRVHSAPGKGTRLEARVPTEEEA